jgi:gamma-glutamyltranspeptidase/glutathione hydrolase
MASVDTEFLEPIRVRVSEPQRVSVSKKGMVATAHFRATEAGAQVLGEGGNAIDAAVAAAFALGVCEPQASGLGGQTMMLIHLSGNGVTTAIDGSSRAPNRALQEKYRSRRSRKTGFQATTVPSTPATLGYVLDRYGTLPLPDVLAPAIALARNGYPITELQRRLQQRELKNFARGNAGSIFLRDGSRSFATGTLFRQPVLAETLVRLSQAGIEDFYTGELAEVIHQHMTANGGLLHRDDLAQIPYPIERVPVTGRLRGIEIHTMPPPGAGRTLIEMINILKRFPAAERDLDTPPGALLLAEVIQRAQLDRRDRPFDPNFYPQVQDRRMLSEKYARRVADQIRSRIQAHGETTHLSVMDYQGNAVALTQSIERVYGAKVMTPELGFLYNNYLSAFEYEDITHPYYLRPNGVPWASVAPTIIFRSNRPWLAIGSVGSDRITSTILQVLLRLRKQSPFDAVSSPRLHCSYGRRVSIEAALMRDDIPKLLAKKGFKLDIRRPMSFYLGCVQLVLAESDQFVGVADPRRDGSASGPLDV